MAWETRTESEQLVTDANFEFLKDSAGNDVLVVQLSPGETLSGNMRYHPSGTTDDIEFEVLAGTRYPTGGDLDAVTSAQVMDLETLVHPIDADDEMNGNYLFMTSGAARGEGRIIQDSTNADDRVTLDRALGSTPGAGDTYDLYALSVVVPFAELPSAVGPTPSEPHSFPFEVSGYEFVCFRARSSGGTDTQKVQVSINTDGVNL